MSNNILIFRTDRIGDLLVTCPTIISIKNYLKSTNLVLITSNKNYEYALSLDLFDEVYKFPEKGIFNKIFFILRLIKKKFDYIYVFDGKERSIISTFFIRSKFKVALMDKNKFFYKFMNIKFFLDTEETNLTNIFQQFLSYTNINTKISNYDFLSSKIDNNFSSEIKIKNYLHIHLDEKWFNNIYIKNYTNIGPSYNEFVEFLEITSKEKDVLITTGLIDFDLINELKNKFFKKVNKKIFIKQGIDKSIYLIYKPTFKDLVSLLRHSDILIACHGSITHAANSFNVKKIDILEKNKIKFYRRFTSYLKNYYPIYRSNFSNLKTILLNTIKE